MSTYQSYDSSRFVRCRESWDAISAPKPIPWSVEAFSQVRHCTTLIRRTSDCHHVPSYALLCLYVRKEETGIGAAKVQKLNGILTARAESRTMHTSSISKETASEMAFSIESFLSGRVQAGLCTETKAFGESSRVKNDFSYTSSMQ